MTSDADQVPPGTNHPDDSTGSLGASWGTKLAAIVILIVAIPASTIAIVELTARNHFSLLLTHHIDELGEMIARAELANAKTSDPDRDHSADAVKSIESRRRNQLLLMELRMDLLALIATGARGDDENLRQLRIRAAGSSEAPVLTAPERSRSRLSFWKTLTLDCRCLSTDELLLTITLWAGVVGALTHLLWRQRAIGILGLLTRAALGVAAGYITFLLIRSGRSVIVIESGQQPIGSVPLFNPYVTALLGVLSGFLSDHVFRSVSRAGHKALDRAFDDGPSARHEIEGRGERATGPQGSVNQ
ncbi:MAG: hypothetical protein ACF8PN_04815 [Phycisphaerales bacterium]